MELLPNNPYLLAVVILTLLNAGAVALLAFWFRRYQKKQRALLAGEEVANLEDLVLKHKKLLSSHNKNLRELGQILEELVEKNKLNLQKAGLVRFNPFAETGGNMSFSLALLDGQNNGIVISSLHSREATRIYAKPVEHGQSKYQLTDEERQAIEQANQKSNIKIQN